MWKTKKGAATWVLSKCWVLFSFRGNDRNAITEHCTCSLVRFSSHKHCVFDQVKKNLEIIKVDNICRKIVWCRNYLFKKKIGIKGNFLFHDLSLKFRNCEKATKFEESTYTTLFWNYFVMSKKSWIFKRMYALLTNLNFNTSFEAMKDDSVNF